MEALTRDAITEKCETTRVSSRRGVLVLGGVREREEREREKA